MIFCERGKQGIRLTNSIMTKKEAEVLGHMKKRVAYA